MNELISMALDRGITPPCMESPEQRLLAEETAARMKLELEAKYDPRRYDIEVWPFSEYISAVSVTPKPRIRRRIWRKLLGP